ncbi:VOC family protein [Sphingomonas fennica]|uniref:VOC family virulence protein n=1 Tax=Edaphosphingomonas fennica TaxID=114404 RepID=A0A2T4HMU8_9SPHN|nr:VOC family protein [Sphingomonas fennica]PTD17086.1 VOC family virulence protein [Sphingomonas fennica]
MISIAAIDHVVLRVVDLDRMIRFYTGILGARLEKVQAEIGLYQLRLGTALVDLVPVEGALGAMGGAPPGREGRNVDHVCFRVSPWDGDAILAFLAGHGIAAEIASRYGAEGEGPSIYLADPEGNMLELKGPPWPVGPEQDRI